MGILSLCTAHNSRCKRRICFFTLIIYSFFIVIPVVGFWEYRFVLDRFHLNSSHLLHIFLLQHFSSSSILSFILDLSFFFSQNAYGFANEMISQLHVIEVNGFVPFFHHQLMNVRNIVIAIFSCVFIKF